MLTIPRLGPNAKAPIVDFEHCNFLPNQANPNILFNYFSYWKLYYEHKIFILHESCMFNFY